MKNGMNSAGFVSFLEAAAKKIADSRDYITQLDSATGDGDHWINLNNGYVKILQKSDELRQMTLHNALRAVGMTMMSAVGGSSGVLYGSAYLAAAKVCEKTELEDADLLVILRAMCTEIATRGAVEPGFKTMLDAIHPAVAAFAQALAKGITGAPLYQSVKQAALNGAQSTRDMEARRGRACYQADKGVGHLDPGAVTAAYQIACLMDEIQKQGETI